MVTLLTGDTVTVTGDGRDVVVEPGAGRDDIRFLNRSQGTHLYVIPSDADEFVAEGMLDRRLFDVTGLVKFRYDDTSQRDVPLLLTYNNKADRAATRAGLADAGQTTRSLSSIGGDVVTLAKGEAGKSWAALRSAMDGNKVEKIWLDGRRKVLLDDSVPQIGAPQAWGAGYTGKGSQVAVLDTGIDAEHPDLADAVVAAEDFTGSPTGTRDAYGHGTHVASIITGSGTASGGRYKGVAPDAELLVGKVLGDDGFGSESDIIAGMEWAAKTKQADVVNMSFGGFDEPEVDPIEQAVNDLTAQTGTLFVVAAGNDGPGLESINSPGSAAAALTVGAVTKQDQVWERSSRGPTASHALKPDLTAPGADIVAARAQGTELGDPVGEHYVTASGTSMATPHVAGAAALLAGQHPGWTARELKAALVASAKPNPTLNAYDQGTGRVDLTTAITQTVVSDPTSLSFGLQRWPHSDDALVNKGLTYRNLGDAQVELDLKAELTTANGEPAPDGAIELSADTVTIPAGETATVTVTSNTNHDGPDGRYVGQITATTGQQDPSRQERAQTVATPIAVEREVESYDLTLRTIGPDGKQAPGLGHVLNLRGFQYGEANLYDEDGQATARLPKGAYLLEDRVEGENSYLMVQPTVRLDKDVTITAEARTTKPISTTVQHSGATPLLVAVGYHRDIGGPDDPGYQASIVDDSFDHIFTAQIGPRGPVKGMTGSVASQWAEAGPDGQFNNSPYTYSLLDTVPGRFFTGYHRDVSDSDLAVLKASYHPQKPGQKAELLQFGLPPGFFFADSIGFEYDLPANATHYVEGSDISWQQWLQLSGDKPGPTYRLQSQYQRYPTGKTIEQRWNAAVFTPAWTPPGEDVYFYYAERIGDRIAVALPMYSDADGHIDSRFSELEQATTTLARNGEVVAGSEYATYVDAKVSPGNAEYRLESAADRSSVSDFSTKTVASWTFRSDTADSDGVVLPIWAVRFAPDVDERNVNHDAGKVTRLPVTFQAPPGAETGLITKAKLEVSTNDGNTWTAAELRPGDNNSYLANFVTPSKAKYVSLRGTATDSKGNTIRLEVIRAYQLAN
ncbi:S8 family peptidase [Flindersiella endophytica]